MSSPADSAARGPFAGRGRRSDIEGLRALAVVLVVAYHCGLGGMGGGFVGVDVFFALSGYLMTGLLLDERSTTGRIDLIGFYARRVRRLLPAAAISVLVTVVAAVIVLDPLSLRRLMGDVVSVATYSTNVRFARQGADYLQSDLAASPLLHHWSLAVEEQFYLVWPLLLLAATTRSRRDPTSSRMPLAALATVTITSLTLSLVLTRDHAVWSFFGLHTRAWEFGIGGLAVLVGRALGSRAAPWRAVSGWTGLALVLAAAVTFDERVAYPGWHALVPVLGTVLVLDAVVARRGPRVLLDRRPAVWLGGRSYAIYLWHWPPLVLVPIALERALSTAEAVAVALAAGLVAVLVQRLVEDPLRHAPVLVARRGATYAMGVTLMAVLVGTSALVTSSIDLDGRGVAAGEPTFANGVLDVDGGGHALRAEPAPRNLEPSLAVVAEDEPSIYASGCHLDILTIEPSDCRIGEGRRTIALLGDSHAAQWFPALVEIAARHDAAVLVMTKSGCAASTAPRWNTILKRDFVECDTWRERVLSELETDPPDVVVMSSYPMPLLHLPDGLLASGPEHEAAWRRGTLTTLERLHASGAQVLLIGPIPRSAGRRPECVAAHLDDVTVCARSRRRVEQRPYVDIERRVAADVGVDFVDPTDWVCGRRRCPAVVGRYLVYRDTSHLTTAFVRSLVPELEPYVTRALARSAE